MTIRDIMLTMISYPEPTPVYCLEAAAQLAQAHGARLKGVLYVPIMPPLSNPVADGLAAANEARAEFNRKSEANAQALVAELVRLAGVEPTSIRGIGTQNVVDPRAAAEHARLFDLAIVPAHGHPDTVAIAEALVFSSGRPMLLLPAENEAPNSGRVIVGWDGGGPAARAIGDAMPFLKRAQSVEIVTVTGGKRLPSVLSGEQVSLYLDRHEVPATTAYVAGGGVDAGRALLHHCSRSGADMLVMGAYDQSRLSEFVPGGATRTVIAEARLPVLISR